MEPFPRTVQSWLPGTRGRREGDDGRDGGKTRAAFSFRPLPPSLAPSARRELLRIPYTHTRSLHCTFSRLSFIGVFEQSYSLVRMT